MQYFCKRMQNFLWANKKFFGETQYLCKWMLGFSEKRDTFAREYKCFEGECKVSQRNVIILRESKNVLFCRQSFLEKCITFVSEYNVSLSNAIFLQANAKFQSNAKKINTFASEGIHLRVNAKFLGETQYFCKRVQMCANLGSHLGSRGLKVRDPKVASSSLRSGRNCRWGEWMYSTLSTLNTTTEVPLSKAPNPQLLPGRRGKNGCPLLQVCVHGVCVFSAVCVHFGWVKCRAQIPSMGHHTWSYVTSLSSSLLLSQILVSLI